jgi:hypothetical protein
MLASMKILRRMRMMGRQKSNPKTGTLLTNNGTTEGETKGVKKVDYSVHIYIYIYMKKLTVTERLITIITGGRSKFLPPLSRWCRQFQIAQ